LQYDIARCRYCKHTQLVRWIEVYTIGGDWLPIQISDNCLTKLKKDGTPTKEMKLKTRAWFERRVLNASEL
jgi:hypothetical protein